MGEDARPYWVLVVEDDPDHVMLIQAVFARFDHNAHIKVTRTVEEAIVYLRGPWPETAFAADELPDVIVLDIGMLGVGGLGFLTWYDEQPKVAHVPVVVFTSSGDPDLERQCLALGAKEFKEKPTDFGELVPVVHRVLDRWLPEQMRASG